MSTYAKGAAELLWKWKTGEQMSRPNILFMITEQHRGDCLGIEEHPVLQTPNIDHIAAEGVRFIRAYSTCPTCTAARRSLLSG